MATFKEWKLAQLEARFGVRQSDNSASLTEWLRGEIELSEFENKLLGELQNRLKKNLLHWNEWELSLYFIGPLFSFANFTGENYNLFDERELKAVVDGENMVGNPDGMIAFGFREPEKPFFCLQEYKKETDPNGDPVAQCLAAMLTAQAINQDQLPVYGIYVIGQNWSFVVLEGKKYTVSSAYSAISPEIYDIFSRLKFLKRIVEKRVAILTKAETSF